MLINIFWLLLGFILLIKSSDVFVDTLSSIATNFKMPKMLIALTLAAFGTCAPELSISFTGMIKGSGDLVLANVIGSCIVNVLLIIGMAASFFPIRVKNATVKKEIPQLFIITSLFVISLLGNMNATGSNILNRIDGFLFFLFFVLFLFYIISLAKMPNADKSLAKPKYSMRASIFLSIVCIVLIIIGSNLVVDNAVIIAKMLNVSEKFITMTVIVIGTSLPELTMTVIAAKKQEFDIAIGNIIGTNIFNIGVVLGIPLMIYGGFPSNSFHYIDIIALFLSGLLLLLVSRNDKIISKKEGLLMVLIFIIYYTYLAAY